LQIRNNLNFGVVYLYGWSTDGSMSSTCAQATHKTS